MKTISLLGVLAMMVTAAAIAAPSPHTEVRVKSGMVRGVVVDDVAAFKGIPFAAPPVGALRWRAPQPAKPWQGVLDASDHGNDCMQLPFPSDAAPLGAEPSEDCLYLNIWRPANGEKNLPVMVWIYGGGFVNGGSSPEVYDGSAFARDGVVLVSFNYRLGRFGFFAHPALSTADEGPVGNFGLMDQHAALRWVRDNIAAFGGDPDQVTVFGESAGGMSVTSLLGAPAARSLFHRAIIMSGGGRSAGPVRRMSEDLPNLPSAETIGMNFARKHGIDGTGAGALDALRALPMEKVIDGFNLATLFRGGEDGVPTWSGTFVDGITLVDSNEALFARGDHGKVPVIAGATSADIGFAPASSKDELFARFGDRADEARAAFDPAGDASLQATIMAVGGTQFMIEPARYLASQFAASGQPAWHYRFSYVAKSMRGEWQGAPHATEIPYAFETVAAKYGEELALEDEVMARAMNAYFVNFAKTGDPNGSGLPVWAGYEEETRPVLDFTLDRGPVGGDDPWRGQLDLVTELAEGQLGN